MQCTAGDIVSFLMAGCLGGILGAALGTEQCLMTWGQGENFYTVADMFGTDWMALWSLNGGDAPDVAKVDTSHAM